MPKINEYHKEMVFTKWDAQIKKAEQAAEEAGIAARNVIDCVNENMHRANLILENTLRFLPKTSNYKQVGDIRLKKGQIQSRS